MPTTRATRSSVDPAAAAAAAAAAASLVPPNPGPSGSGGSGSGNPPAAKPTKKGGKKTKKTGAAGQPTPPAGQDPTQGQGGGATAAPPAGQGATAAPPPGPTAAQLQGQAFYDPCDPTDDDGDRVTVNRLELAADLKDFLGEHIADVKEDLKRDLIKETRRLQQLFDQKVTEEVDYIKRSSWRNPPLRSSTTTIRYIGKEPNLPLYF